MYHIYFDLLYMRSNLTVTNVKRLMNAEPFKNNAKIVWKFTLFPGMILL